MKQKFRRRSFLQRAGRMLAGLGILGSQVPGCAGIIQRSGAKVVVIGGGYGGAAAARYLRHFSPELDISLVEPQRTYYSCPFSNPVLAGMEPETRIMHSYSQLQSRFRIRVIHDSVKTISPGSRTITLADNTRLDYDRLVLSPGISFRWEHIFSGYNPAATGQMPHAWKAGKQTLLLRNQLRAMPDGGVFVIVVPGPPFRCPPGPYERASLVAWYFQQYKPRSKILILDANEHFSKQDLFEEAWQRYYPDIIERVPISAGGLVTRVDPQAMQVIAEAGTFRADVFNIIPFQQAGQLALQSLLADDTGWCPVNHQTFESLLVPGIHIIGDSCLAGAMPKSASSANSQAKVCSKAIVNTLNDRPPGAMIYHNTCYSLIRPDYGISINAMYRYTDNRIKLVERAGGVSPLRASDDFRRAEARYARDWFDSINADTFGHDS